MSDNPCLSNTWVRKKCSYWLTSVFLNVAYNNSNPTGLVENENK